MKRFLAILVVVLISAVCTQQAQIPNCAAVSCVVPDCPVTETPPGECCPVCETPNCAAVSCVRPDCPVTETPPGECCPVCVTPNCAAVSCLLPDCPVTETPPGECCPVCVTPPGTCTYKGKIIESGKTFMKECNKCRCIKGMEMCTKKRCRVSIPGCRQGKKFYKEGASVPSKNPCESCVCSNSAITCFIQDCARPPCEPEFQMVPKGQCCPVCAKPAIIDGYPVA